MDRDVVIAATCFVGHVVVSQLDAWPSFSYILVDAIDSEPRWEDNIADARTKSLQASVSHAIIMIVVAARARPESVAHRPSWVVSLPRVVSSSVVSLESV